MSALPRVLLVGPTPPPEGGMARVVEDCRQALLAGQTYAPQVIEIKHNSARRLGALDLTNIRLNMQLYHLLRSELARANTPLVHMHASVGSRGTVMKHILLARAVRSSRAKLLLQPHSGAIEELLRSGNPAWKAGMTRLLKLADTVVVTSSYWLELMQQHWPNLNYALLANGVDTAHYAPLPVAQHEEKRADVKVLFIGHLTAYKGLSELAEAWSHLKQQGAADAVLRLVGEARDAGGQALADALSTLQDVRLMGFITSNEKLALLQDSDIFVLPSHYENLPISLLEAMSCGLACVATAVGAVPEMLADGCGSIVPPQDSSALAAALGSLIADRELRQSMGRSARQRALDNYSSERFARGLHELYDSAVQQSPARKH